MRRESRPVSPQQLIVYPNPVKLSGERDEQRLIVLGVWTDGRKWDLTESARYAADNHQCVTTDKGIVRPLAEGSTSITIEALGAKISVPVIVERFNADIPVGFTREIEPILTKAGCNSGACHGASLGRGGFRLSLFGFDPVFDHGQIVQSNKGRRIVPNDPERSILLAKPALVMEHAGGERLKLNSRHYNLIRQWLEDGAPHPISRTQLSNVCRYSLPRAPCNRESNSSSRLQPSGPMARARTSPPRLSSMP